MGKKKKLIKKWVKTHNMREMCLVGDSLVRLLKRTSSSKICAFYDALQRGEISFGQYIGSDGNLKSLEDEISLEDASFWRVRQWIARIKKGQIPAGNLFAKGLAEWIGDYAKERLISLPEYKIVSNKEFPEAFNLIKQINF